MAVFLAGTSTLLSAMHELPCPGMAGVLFALMMPGLLFSYESGIHRLFSKRSKRCPRNWRNKTQGGDLTVPLTVNAEQGAAVEAWGLKGTPRLSYA